MPLAVARYLTSVEGQASGPVLSIWRAKVVEDYLLPLGLFINRCSRHCTCLVKILLDERSIADPKSTTDVVRQAAERDGTAEGFCITVSYDSRMHRTELELNSDNEPHNFSRRQLWWNN